MLRIDFVKYSQQAPCGSLIYILTMKDGTEIRTEGPHKVGEIIHIIGSDVFGRIVAAPYPTVEESEFLQVIWDDGILSSAFRPNACFNNIIKLDNDSPQERLKIKLKYADYT